MQLQMTLIYKSNHGTQLHVTVDVKLGLPISIMCGRVLICHMDACWPLLSSQGFYRQIESWVIMG